MDDRNRQPLSSCGEVIAYGLLAGTSMVLSSLAVERWGVIAFALILVVMVVAAFGLVAMGWVRRGREGRWLLLVLLFAITTSEMVQALSMPLWGSWLLAMLIVLAGWLVGSREFPWWESMRGDSRR